MAAPNHSCFRWVLSQEVVSESRKGFHLLIFRQNLLRVLLSIACVRYERLYSTCLIGPHLDLDSGRVCQSMAVIKHSSLLRRRWKSPRIEALRQVNSIVDADATTETAFKTLKLRYRLPRNTSTRL